MNKLIFKAILICVYSFIGLSSLYANTNMNLFNEVESSDIIMSGTVVDEFGETIEFVSIIVSGSSIGTFTDLDGNFSLVIPTKYKNSQLLVSCIGMVDQKVKIESKKGLRIKLERNLEEIGTVIVTGMETVKKERMTGAVYSIGADELKSQGAISIDRVFDGLIPGLNSTIESGAPGARARIAIRGENNLSRNSEPLWIVDGLPLMQGVPSNNSGDYVTEVMQDGVGNIMPNDIASITILKDAAATAIYGARAANGVIVVETKKGYKSDTQIDYYGTFDIGVAPKNNLDFMNSKQKLQYEDLIVKTFGIIDPALYSGRGAYLAERHEKGYITQAEYNTELDKLKAINTDWFDEIFRTSISHSHNLNVRGGTGKFNYYASLSFQDKEGILRSNKYQNSGILTKFKYTPNNKLSFSLNVSANTRKNIDHASVIDPFNYAVYANPYEKPYNDDGSYAADLTYINNNRNSLSPTGYEYNELNILKELNETRNTQTGLDATATFSLNWKIYDGLNFESIFRKGTSYNIAQREVNQNTYTSWAEDTFLRRAFQNNKILPDGYDNGSLTEKSGRDNSWAIRNQLKFEKTYSKIHNVSFLLANEIMSRHFNNFSYNSPIYFSDYRITGLPIFDSLPELEYNDMLSVLDNLYNTSDGQDRSVSFLGSFRYTYKNKYVANMNFRMDGADVIGNQNQFTPLYSLGLRYNLHNEDFFKNDIVTFLSLRGSQGYTGNIDRTAYPFSTMTLSSYEYYGNRIISKLGFPNPTVGWEKKLERNLGLDLTLIDRFSLTIDSYSNTTTDILSNLNVPPSTGRTSVRANGGIVSNKGIELLLNAHIVRTRDFTFSVSANFAKNQNIIVKSQHGAKSLEEAISKKTFNGGVLNVDGQATGSIYGLKIVGINPKTGNPQFPLSEEGKKSYANFLEGFAELSPYKQLMFAPTIESFDEIPDYVDLVKTNSDRYDYITSSFEHLGSINPKLTGGFNTYITYKNFEFNTSWTFKTGHLIPTFNDYKNPPGANGSGNDIGASRTNREVKYLDFWQAPGDITSVPSALRSGDSFSHFNTSINYAKGDYLRMTNLSLNYKFDSSLLKKAKIRSLSLGINARNLLTFTKYPGIDVGTNGAFTYPVSKEFTFRLMIGF